MTRVLWLLCGLCLGAAAGLALLPGVVASVVALVCLAGAFVAHVAARSVSA